MPPCRRLSTTLAGWPASRSVTNPPKRTAPGGSARVYDALLGGKDNYAADREEAERLLEIYPQLRDLVRENRQFVTRAVTWAAQQAGVAHHGHIPADAAHARRTSASAKHSPSLNGL
jgi:hypothetical protein